jgi:NADP-dependent 3-hydroxy acid dehydrogenase YdfG
MPGEKPVAVVTGASRGIGRAVATRLARVYEVVALARSEGELASLAIEIGSFGGLCLPCAVDVTNPHALAAALESVVADVVVSNAGIGYLKPFLQHTREEWRRTVDVNLNAHYDLARLLVPAMVARGSGHVVIIGSTAGRGAFVGGACYAATKHAVMAFGECLMLELRDAGVRVSVVNPGAVASNFTTTGDPGWMLSPDDIAASIAELLAASSIAPIFGLEVRPRASPRSR